MKFKKIRSSTGKLISEYDIYVGSNTTLPNNINIPGSIYLGDNCMVKNVTASGDIIIGNNVKAGNLSAGRDIILGSNAHTKDLLASEDISVSNNSITGDLSAGSNITVGRASHIGYSFAGNSVYIEPHCETSAIFSLADATISHDCTVDGEISVMVNIYIGKRVSDKGRILGNKIFDL